MIDHLPWIGDNYWKQPTEDRRLIVGFSHWKGNDNPAPDKPEFTRGVFKDHVLAGGIRFFNTIAGFFDATDRAAFWHQVAFANTLPNIVGGPEDRYAAGSKEQKDAVDERVDHLIGKLKPARIFVFTKKGWRLWPNYTGQLCDGTLRLEGMGEFDAGTYRHEDGEAIAFGFPHPQYTPVAPMRTAIKAALRASVADLSSGEGR